MKLIKTAPPPTARRVAAIVFWVALAARVLLLGAQLFAGLAIAGKVTLPLLNFVVLGSALFLIRRKHALLFWLAGVLILCNAVYLLAGNDGAEYYFSSPQKTNTLVVREKSALISSGWAELYRLRYGIFLERLEGKVGTDDNYQPFSHGQYRLEWADENAVSIYYYDGHGYKQLQIAL